MCENVDFYPHQYIEDVLKKYSLPKALFGQSEVTSVHLHHQKTSPVLL